MKESEAKWIVLIVLLIGILVSVLVTPPEFKLYAAFGYIGIFVVAAYLKNGVIFGYRIYPWGVEYNKRSKKCTGLIKKKPKKKGKTSFKRK